MGKHLIACLGQGKGTWGHVARLISDVEWDSILLISNEWGKEKFQEQEKQVNWLLVNTRSSFDTMKNQIKNSLPEGELIISITSGSGKEHMALLVALKEAEKSYKLVTLTKDGIQFY